MTRDELAGGPERSRPRWPLAVLAVLAVALVLGARWQEDRRIDELVTAAGEAEQVLETSASSRGGLLTYSAALLARGDVPPRARQAVLRGIAQDAERYTAEVAERRAGVAAVDPLPWERRAARLQEAYLARVDAWTAYVEAARADPEAVLRERRLTGDARQEAADAVAAASDGAAADELERRLSP